MEINYKKAFVVYVTIVILTLLQVACSTVNKGTVENVTLQRHQLNDYTKSTEFDFLGDMANEKTVVQLGESIHMTHEQPLARIGLIQKLKENNFDVIAFEGSTIDFWIAMDEFLHSKRAINDMVKFRKTAFFGLWQTKEMDEVVKAALEKKPLYITSFDIQPGIGVGFRKKGVFSEFARVLSKYEPMYRGEELKSLLSALEPLHSCGQNGFPKSKEQEDQALNAIGKLDQWASKAKEKVRQKFPNISHAETLTLVPMSLRKTVELCHAHQNNTDKNNKWAAYQPKRDELNAEMVTAIVEKASTTKHLMLWAHHSHVNYNTLQRVRITLGQALKKYYGEKVYTIGVFAKQGNALVGQEEPELKSMRPISDSEIDIYLSKLSDQSFYLDLTSPMSQQENLFLRSATIRIEGIGLWTTKLAKDYDAIIYLKEVSPPKVDFGP